MSVHDDLAADSQGLDHHLQGSERQSPIVCNMGSLHHCLSLPFCMELGKKFLHFAYSYFVALSLLFFETMYTCKLTYFANDLFSFISLMEYGWQE